MAWARCLNAVAILGWICLLLSPSVHAQSLAELDSILDEVKTFDQFLRNLPLQQRYEEALVKYVERKKFRCESFPVVLARLDKLTKQTPLLRTRLWSKRPVEVLSLAGFHGSGEQRQPAKYVFRTSARAFHDVFADPRSATCPDDVCQLTAPLKSHRWWALALDSRIYYVEKEDQFTDHTIHFASVFQGNKAHRWMMLGGGSPMLKVPFIVSSNRAPQRSRPLYLQFLSLVSRSPEMRRMRFVMESSKDGTMLISHPAVATSFTRLKRDLDFKLSDPVFTQFAKKAAASCAEQGTPPSLAVNGGNTQPPLVPLAGTAAAGGNTPGAESATSDDPDIALGAKPGRSGKTALARSPASESPNDALVPKFSAPQFPDVPTSSIPSTGVANGLGLVPESTAAKLSRGAEVPEAEARDYINRRRGDPGFPDRLAGHIFNSANPGNLARAAFNPASLPSGSGRQPSSANPVAAGGDSGWAPSTPFDSTTNTNAPGSTGETQEGTPSANSQSNSARSTTSQEAFENALVAGLEKRAKNNCLKQIEQEVEGNQALWNGLQWKAWLAKFENLILQNAYAAPHAVDEETTEDSEKGCWPRILSGKDGERAMNNKIGRIGRVRYEKNEKGECSWMHKKRKRESVELLPGSFVPGHMLGDKDPGCVYLLYSGGAIKFSCFPCSDKTLEVQTKKGQRRLMRDMFYRPITEATLAQSQSSSLQKCVQAGDREEASRYFNAGQFALFGDDESRIKPATDSFFTCFEHATFENGAGDPGAKVRDCTIAATACYRVCELEVKHARKFPSKASSLLPKNPEQADTACADLQKALSQGHLQFNDQACSPTASAPVTNK